MPTVFKQRNKTSSPIIQRLKQNYHSNKRLFFIIMLLQLIGLPLLSVVAQISFYLEKTDPEYNDSLRIYMLLAALAFAFASASGILFSFRSFKYLYKKTETDMNLSLPMTASQRFLGDYLSGLIMYAVPYIVACVLSGISLIIGKSCYPQFLISMSNHMSVLNMMTDVLLVMIMLYTITTFITVCCGNSFECLIYTVLINITIPAFFLVLNYIIFYDAFGIEFEQQSLGSVMATSPVGGLLKILYYSNALEYVSSRFYVGNCDDYIITWNASWCLPFIFITIILFAAAFYLYRKRKAEDVSKPFVFSFIYYIFILAVTTGIVGTMIRINAVVAGIIISAFIFAVMSVIKNRGFHKMLRPCICYVVSVAAAFSIVKLSNITDGFNQIYKVPDTSDIKSVSFDICDDFFSEYPQYTSSEFTDKDDIKLITDLQSDIIDDYKDHNCVKYYYEDMYYYLESFFNKYSCKPHLPETESIRITYLMNNNSISYRTYNIPYSIWSEYMIKISDNHSYRQQKAEKFGNEILRGKSALLWDGVTKYRYHITMSDPRYSIQEDIEISDENILKDLAEAYEKDIMAMTTDDIMDFKSFCAIETYYIGTGFTNTIDFLTKNGFKVSQLEDYTKRIDYINNTTFFIADSDFIIENNNLETNLITTDCGSPTQYIVKEHDNDLLLKLFNVAESHYITSEHCYVIELGGRNFIIPPEYSELAEEFIEHSKLEKVEITQKDNQ